MGYYLSRHHQGVLLARPGTRRLRDLREFGLMGTRNDARHRLMLGVDIQGSSDHRRDESLSSELVDTLEDLLIASFQCVGVADAYSYQNRGDGGRFDFSDVSPIDLITAVMKDFPARLRSHNKRAGESIQLSVRFAIHHGYVVPRIKTSDHNGRAVEQLHGILDSTEVRDAARGHDWVLAISEAVWRDIVAPGHGDLDKDSFTQRQAHIKRHGEVPIWITGGIARRPSTARPSVDAPTDTDAPAAERSASPVSAPVRGIVFGGTTTIHDSNVSGGDQYIDRRDG